MPPPGPAREDTRYLSSLPLKVGADLLDAMLKLGIVDARFNTLNFAVKIGIGG